MKTKKIIASLMVVFFTAISFGASAQDFGYGDSAEFPWVKTIVWSVLGILAIILFFSSFVIVKPKQAKSIEMLGKFQRVVTSGLAGKLPWIAYVGREISLQMQEIRVKVSTITKDKVTVVITVAIQFYVKEDKEMIYKAMYELSDPEQQIQSYVYNEVRSIVPVMDLDDVFEEKNKIEDAVKSGLTANIEQYGYTTQNALVVDIDPDAAVVASMNRINAAERNAKAAEKEGDAEKILIVKKAEAQSDSKKLQGEGIANQRRAIASGIKDSVELLKATGVDPKEASALIIVTQHYDTLESIGKNSNSNLILMPNSPASATDIMTQMTAALHAHEASKGIAPKKEEEKE